jgi:hypothetical protein
LSQEGIVKLVFKAKEKVLGVDTSTAHGTTSESIETYNMHVSGVEVQRLIFHTLQTDREASVLRLMVTICNMFMGWFSSQ